MPLNIVLAISLLVAPGQAPSAQTSVAPSQPAPRGSEGLSAPIEYTIGPEDILGVIFWREPDISGDVTVRPDGKITLPVIGELQAAGLRPSELQGAVKQAAAKYLTDINVAVVVRTINSRKIYVTGRVASPGAHSLVGPLTVMQAISLAGGLTEYANAKGITVVRSRGGQSERFKFNYRDVVKGKSMEQNIQLQPGDTVVVP